MSALGNILKKIVSEYPTLTIQCPWMEEGFLSCPNSDGENGLRPISDHQDSAVESLPPSKDTESLK